MACRSLSVSVLALVDCRILWIASWRSSIPSRELRFVDPATLFYGWRDGVILASLSVLSLQLLNNGANVHFHGGDVVLSEPASGIFPSSISFCSDIPCAIFSSRTFFFSFSFALLRMISSACTKFVFSFGILGQNLPRRVFSPWFLRLRFLGFEVELE